MHWPRNLVFLLIPISILHQDDGTYSNNIHEYNYSRTINFTEKSSHRLMRKQHLPAMAISIVSDQETIYQAAFGLSDMENNIEASTGTTFKLYSVAKVFTATEIFREMEEGLIDLEDPITAYLPEFSIQSRFKNEEPITIKSILAHRSGLPRNECVMIHPGDADLNTLDRFETATADCFKAYPTGSRYKYSNLGYNLLGRIIEQNRGEGFSPFMKKHLLHDLGMENSAFRSPDVSKTQTLAKGYEFYKGDYFPMIQSDINSIPSGNLYSTIEDLSIFLKAVFGNRVFEDQGTLPRMFEDHFSTTADPETMGLGWKTTRINESELLIWHDGGPDEGIGALIAFLPSRKLGIAVIGNSTRFSGNVSMPFVISIFNDMLSQVPEPRSGQGVDPASIIGNERPLEDLEGTYAAFGQIMKIEAKRNKLKARIGGMTLGMVPVNDTEFRITHWMDKIGLTKLFKPPIDFDRIKIEFSGCSNGDSCQMIINLDRMSYELCPRYSMPQDTGVHMSGFTGEYLMADRLPSNEPGIFTGSKYSIQLEDNVLVMSGIFGPVVPANKSTLIILSGPFAGETIEVCNDSGNLIHQKAVFVPVDPQEIL